MDSPGASVAGRAFRANAAYELLLFDRLEPKERAALAELRSDPSFYGVLRPRPGCAQLGRKSIDRETALLFLTLAQPGPLPAYVNELFGDDANRAVARLVADGILEVDAGEGFVCGADALALLRPATLAGTAGRIASLSRDALRYAQALAIEEPLELANRIYGYHRMPLTPRWQRVLSSDEDHARYLGIANGGAAAKSLARGGAALSRSSSWLSWSLPSRRAPPRRGGTYKLYVSPTADALTADGFASILSALVATPALQFKAGAGAAGLLRPDKIVAYFTGFEPLAEAAARLCERLEGMPAHGVPFTAEIGADGLLSWGVDPPPSPHFRSSGERSWRLWLARGLARAMLSARHTAEPWRFAVERLALEGIDTQTWTPGPTIFGETS